MRRRSADVRRWAAAFSLTGLFIWAGVPAAAHAQPRQQPQPQTPSMPAQPAPSQRGPMPVAPSRPGIQLPGPNITSWGPQHEVKVGSKLRFEGRDLAADRFSATLIAGPTHHFRLPRPAGSSSVLEITMPVEAVTGAKGARLVVEQDGGSTTLTDKLVVWDRPEFTVTPSTFFNVGNSQVSQAGTLVLSGIGLSDVEPTLFSRPPNTGFFGLGEIAQLIVDVSVVGGGPQQKTYRISSIDVHNTGAAFSSINVPFRYRGGTGPTVTLNVGPPSAQTVAQTVQAPFTFTSARSVIQWNNQPVLFTILRDAPTSNQVEMFGTGMSGAQWRLGTIGLQGSFQDSYAVAIIPDNAVTGKLCGKKFSQDLCSPSDYVVIGRARVVQGIPTNSVAPIRSPITLQGFDLKSNAVNGLTYQFGPIGGENTQAATSCNVQFQLIEHSNTTIRFRFGDPAVTQSCPASTAATLPLFSGGVEVGLTATYNNSPQTLWSVKLRAQQ